MTKQQEQTTFNDVINASEINKAIERLKELLYLYQKSELIKESAYVVQYELTTVYRIMECLQHQIEDIILQSERWEME